MTMTRTDMIQGAYEHLGLVAVGTNAEAHEVVYADRALDGLVGFLTETQGLTLPDDLDVTPDGLGRALLRLLAVDIASAFSVEAEPHSRAVGRVRAYLLSDDRDNTADLDGDGVVTDYEQAADDQSLYY